MRRLLLLVTLFSVGICALSGEAEAQTVVNPVTVAFTPSADHSVNGLDGVPLVTRYEMRVFTQSPLGQTPITTLDLGKPTPAGGTITVTNAVWFSGLTPNVLYVVRVAAVGPTGEGVSDLSNPFGNQGPPQAPSSVLVRK